MCVYQYLLQLKTDRNLRRNPKTRNRETMDSKTTMSSKQVVYAVSLHYWYDSEHAYEVDYIKCVMCERDGELLVRVVKI
jgi:hypothetical protein